MSKKLSAYEIWYGRAEPPARTEHLKAGKFDVEFENGDLRYLRLGGKELLRRVYVAIRDHNWNTIPPEIPVVQITAWEDHFRIDFEAYHKDKELAFRWHAAIEGKPDGTIEYTLDGVAESDFRYNRIGFCVLHPIRGVAGQPFQAITPRGTLIGTLPRLVGPQRIEKGLEAPLFPACSSLTVFPEDGGSVTTRFEGDLFELEDQRNWTDGSFKIYCTPLSLGYPHQVKTGQLFHQKVIIQAEVFGKPAETAGGPVRQATELAIGAASGAHLPRLGFGLPSDLKNFTPREIEFLSRLHPEHLKYELHFRDPDWPAGLRHAAEAVRLVGSQLELALFLGESPADELAELNPLLEGAHLARVIVLSEAEAARGTTSPGLMGLARKILAPVIPGVPLFGGTNGNFAQLNRQPPDPGTVDGIAYPVNPQVHSIDERSLVEAIEAQRDTLVTARSFSANLPIAISSMTLKPPFNQVATEKEAPPVRDALPASVDQRQMALFAAAWTVGSLDSLSAGGASSITCYETTGWKGLMETEHGNPLPGKFPSFPGMVFPLYYLFAALAGAHGAEMLRCESSHSLRLGGLALQKDNYAWVFLANYLPSIQEVRVSGLPEGRAEIRRLHETNLRAATGAPELFQALLSPFPTHDREAALTLQPYETAMIEFKRE